MRLPLTILAGTAVLGAGAADAVAAPPPSSPYVIVLEDSLTDVNETTMRLAKKLGVSTRFSYADAINGFAADLTAAQLAAVQEAPEVAFVEPDQVVAAAGKPAPAPTPAPSEIVPPGVRRVGGDLARGTAGAVAVVDGGIDLANTDLDARNGINCITAGATAKDDNGHGTNVAGIIGARKNGAGVVGVAPGAPLYAVKVLGKTGLGTLSQILCGINWVTANAAQLGIRVANMSVAGVGSDDGNCGNTNADSWHKAICSSTAAGVTWVVAAGNSGKDLATTIPAAYGEALTVTAMSDTDGLSGAAGAAPACSRNDADDRYGSYSNFAVAPLAAAHTMAAPGTCVVSTKLGGGTSTYNGTSQAAPHVAAAAALCVGTSAAPGPCAGLPPAGVIERLRLDATVFGTLANGFLGDLLRPVSGRSYGPLLTAAGY
jgi:subtilisin family serine protease